MSVVSACDASAVTSISPTMSKPTLSNVTVTTSSLAPVIISSVQATSTVKTVLSADNTLKSG